MRKQQKNNELNVIGRFGNFLVCRVGDGQHSWLRVTTADGGWRMEFRDDTEKYGWVMQLCSDERLARVFEMWIVINYHVSGCNPDPRFLEDAVNALEGLKERTAEYYLRLEKELAQEGNKDS